MIKQTLFFSTPVVLSLKNCQMVISWKDCTDKVTRPIEDIGCVVLENQMISITLPLLNELTKKQCCGGGVRQQFHADLDADEP